MNLPEHLEQARPLRRFVAGLINLLIVGLFSEVAQRVLKQEGETGIRFGVLAWITFFWLLCILRRKSVGGAFCLLEMKRTDFSALGRSVYLVRTLPFYLLALVGYFPTGILPPQAVMAQLGGLLLVASVLVVDAAYTLLTRRSLFDRWLNTTVVRLNLPDHLRPRIFGIRVS